MSEASERFVDLKTDKPMVVTLKSGETLTLTVKRHQNRKHPNRVRILSPEIVKVAKQKLDETR